MLLSARRFSRKVSNQSLLFAFVLYCLSLLYLGHGPINISGHIHSNTLDINTTELFPTCEERRCVRHILAIW